MLAGHDDLEAGRRVRRYTITDAGRDALAEARRALRELADELIEVTSALEDNAKVPRGALGTGTCGMPCRALPGDDVRR